MKWRFADVVDYALDAVGRHPHVTVTTSLTKEKKTHNKRETIRRLEIDREVRAMVKGRTR